MRGDIRQTGKRDREDTEDPEEREGVGIDCLIPPWRKKFGKFIVNHGSRGRK